MKKVAAPGLENRRLTAVGTRCADHVTPLYPQKLALTSPTSGSCSVGIVRVRTKATEFSFSLVGSMSGNKSFIFMIYFQTCCQHTSKTNID